MTATLAPPRRPPSRWLPALRWATSLLLLLLGAARSGRAAAQQPTDTIRRVPLERIRIGPPLVRAPAVPDTPVAARVTMPDLSGLMLPDALERLGALGLRVGRVDSVQASGPEGSIVKQWPDAGAALSARALARYPVRLSLAAPGPQPAAPEPVLVPDMVGRTVEEALALLERAGLQKGEVTGPPEGKVVAQAPVARAPVDPGAFVDLQLGLPPEVVVPDLVGRTLAEATGALVALGLQTARVDSEATTGVAGTVLRQTPPPGSRVPPGTGIALVQGVVAAVAPPVAPQARPPEPATPVTEGDRGPRVPWAWILVVVVALAAGAQALWRRSRPSPEEPRPPRPEASPVPVPLRPPEPVAERGREPARPRVPPPEPQPPPGSPPIELSTTWDLGRTELELDGPLEARPAVQLVAHGRLGEREVVLVHDAGFLEEAHTNQQSAAGAGSATHFLTPERDEPAATPERAAPYLPPERDEPAATPERAATFDSGDDHA